MSVSYHVCAIKPADEKFMRMKRIYDECEALEIDPPKEVETFFDGYSPDKNGVRVYLDTIESEVVGYETQWNVKLDELPKDTAIVQFVIK